MYISTEFVTYWDAPEIAILASFVVEVMAANYIDLKLRIVRDRRNRKAWSLIYIDNTTYSESMHAASQTPSPLGLNRDLVSNYCENNLRLTVGKVYNTSTNCSTDGHNNASTKSLQLC
jgi:hypothetical protein